MRQTRILFSSDDQLQEAAEELYGSGLCDVLKCGLGRLELLTTLLIYDPSAVVIGAGSEMTHSDPGLVSTIAALKKSGARAAVFLVVKGKLETDQPIPEGVVMIKYLSSKQVAEEILLTLYKDGISCSDMNVGRSLESNINTIVEQLGITANYTGKTYIVETLRALLSGEITEGSAFSKSVYPMLAKKYSVSLASAEHSIRRAIVKSWERMDEESRERFFGSGYTDGSIPGNREYLMIVYDKLRRMGI